ncbi:hypothetical protein HDV57DRAFT_499668 [Trichoderma longibrachiatum]|uniref:Secreted protein n=1 Tax=Trichoderma longibrachiatum ATCC 18648 TaxID=983965 RepID=A0A2T4BUA7_TRILO|nr:hypothetical protein M440DRAFT_1086601 [Trichoderma longibrachiatum ATCC 18648]
MSGWRQQGRLGCSLRLLCVCWQCMRIHAYIPYHAHQKPSHSSRVQAGLTVFRYESFSSVLPSKPSTNQKLQVAQQLAAVSTAVSRFPLSRLSVQSSPGQRRRMRCPRCHSSAALFHMVTARRLKHCTNHMQRPLGRADASLQSKCLPLPGCSVPAVVADITDAAGLFRRQAL